MTLTVLDFCDSFRLFVLISFCLLVPVFFLMEDVFAPPFYAFIGVILALLFPITVGTIQMNRSFSSIPLTSRKADLHLVFADYIHRVRVTRFWLLQEAVSIHTRTKLHVIILLQMCLCFYLLSEFYELSGTYISFNRFASCVSFKVELPLDVSRITDSKSLRR